MLLHFIFVLHAFIAFLFALCTSFLCFLKVEVSCNFMSYLVFFFLKQWEIYDAYVEDLQKQVRLDCCFLFWLTVFLAFRCDILQQQRIFSIWFANRCLTSIFSFFDFFGYFSCFPEHLAIFQEKIKEKESRKTQTFKKDEDKKKKLMQSEVQVSKHQRTGPVSYTHLTLPTIYSV